MQTSVSCSQPQPYQSTDADEPTNVKQEPEPTDGSSTIPSLESLTPAIFLFAILFVIYNITQLYQLHTTGLPTQESLMKMKIRPAHDAKVIATEAVQLSESLSVFFVSAFAVTFGLLGGVGGPVLFQMGYWILCDWGVIANPNLRVSVLLVYIGCTVPYLVQIFRMSRYVDKTYSSILLGASVAGGTIGTSFLFFTSGSIWLVRSMGVVLLVTLLFHLIKERHLEMEDDQLKAMDNDVEWVVSDIFAFDEFQLATYPLLIAGLCQGLLNGIFAVGGPAIDIYSIYYRTPSKMKIVSIWIGFALGNGPISMIVDGVLLGGFDTQYLKMYMSAIIGGLVAIAFSVSCVGIFSKSRYNKAYKVILVAASLLMFTLRTGFFGRVIGVVIGFMFFSSMFVYFSFLIFMSMFLRNHDEKWFYESERPDE